MAMFHMSNDSHLFRTAEGFAALSLSPKDDGEELEVDHSDATRWLPLYEAKLIHLYDDRWATYDRMESRNVAVTEKVSPVFKITPRYWVSERDVSDRLKTKTWTHQWLIGFRDITNTTNERTVIAAVLPRGATKNKLPLFLFPVDLT